MKTSLIITGSMLLTLAALPAHAVTCRSNGFDGGIPPVVSSLNISDDAGSSVDIDDFSTTGVQKTDPDNSSAILTYDTFTFGSTAIAAISAAGLSMTTGTIITGSSGDLSATVTCD